MNDNNVANVCWMCLHCNESMSQLIKRIKLKIKNKIKIESGKWNEMHGYSYINGIFWILKKSSWSINWLLLKLLIFLKPFLFFVIAFLFFLYIFINTWILSSLYFIRSFDIIFYGFVKNIQFWLKCRLFGCNVVCI